ncbi:hypothetical protein DFH29DRAFT_280512 [Suillus ampliporus]|nr:hypothetical protein DFH29DRAFT_280512 [Suillus ampliporus]
MRQGAGWSAEKLSRSDSRSPWYTASILIACNSVLHCRRVLHFGSLPLPRAHNRTAHFCDLLLQLKLISILSIMWPTGIARTPFRPKIQGLGSSLRLQILQRPRYLCTCCRIANDKCHKTILLEFTFSLYYLHVQQHFHFREDLLSRLSFEVYSKFMMPINTQGECRIARGPHNGR